MEKIKKYYLDLLNQSRLLLSNNYPISKGFMDGALDQKLRLNMPKAVDLPACEEILKTHSLASPITKDLVKAVIVATPHIAWQQSYTKDDGFDSYYLDNYGWFNLVSPDGCFINDDIRISFGYWGAGLHYKEHWHEPEEIYIPIAGEALFHSAGATSKIIKPGGHVVHKSNQPHSLDTQDKPLLALVIWRGTNLNRKPALPTSES